MEELRVIMYNELDINKLVISKKYETRIGDRHYVLLNEKSIFENKSLFQNDGLCNIEDAEKFYLDTPIMSVPFGIDKDNENNNKFYLKAEFYNIKGNKEVETFYKKLLKLEEKIEKKLEHIYKSKYFTHIKKGDIPSMKLKVPFRYGRNEMDIFDSEGNRKTIYDIEEKTLCKFILSPIEIWLNDTYHGILWAIKAVFIINSFNQK